MHGCVCRPDALPGVFPVSAKKIKRPRIFAMKRGKVLDDRDPIHSFLKAAFDYPNSPIA